MSDFNIGADRRATMKRLAREFVTERVEGRKPRRATEAEAPQTEARAEQWRRRLAHEQWFKAMFCNARQAAYARAVRVVRQHG